MATSFSDSAFLTVFVGLGTGFLVAAIVYVAATAPRQRTRLRAVVGLAVAGVALIVIGLLRARPQLELVPKLDQLSQAKAEQLIREHNMVPEPRPLYTTSIASGLVVPGSQDPAARMEVRPGTVVQFSVARNPGPANGPRNGSATVQVFKPQRHQKVYCRRYADGVFRFDVEGSSSGVAEGQAILLWVSPLDPPADVPGWYLQRGPTNGVKALNADGTWMAVGQLGNAQFVPKEGDTFAVAASVAGRETVAALMGAQGVVLREHPAGESAHIETPVTVTLVRSRE